MFLPIVSFADGYGFTYGGRVSTVDLLGIDERLSVPLTWGGTRRAALEFERPFKSGPLTRIDVEPGDLEPREPALRDPRSARRGQGPRRARLRRRPPRRRRRQPQHDQLRRARRRPVDVRHVGRRSTPGSIRPSPATRSWSTAGWTGMHFRTIPGPGQPLHGRRARLSARVQADRRRRPRRLHRRRRQPAALRTAPPRRLLVGPWLRHRRVRRRSHVRRRRPKFACRSPRS